MKPGSTFEVLSEVMGVYTPRGRGLYDLLEMSTTPYIR